jgi:DCN1-like protein 1/2
MKVCEDLQVALEDVTLLALAYELKSPNVGEWPRKGWVDGWTALKCDSLPSMRTTLATLRSKVGSNSDYFNTVYNYTFDFAKQQGQRSLGAQFFVRYLSIASEISKHWM